MTITDFEVINHGIENSQYFQGCGTALTSYEHCVTGIGDTPKEALEDALESAAQSFDLGDNTESLAMASISDDIAVWEIHPDENEMYYHVSIRFNVK